RRPGHVAQVARTGEGAAFGVRPSGPAQVPHDGGLRAGPDVFRAAHVTSSGRTPWTGSGSAGTVWQSHEQGGLVQGRPVRHTCTEVDGAGAGTRPSGQRSQVTGWTVGRVEHWSGWPCRQ